MVSCRTCWSAHHPVVPRTPISTSTTECFAHSRPFALVLRPKDGTRTRAGSPAGSTTSRNPPNSNVLLLLEPPSVPPNRERRQWRDTQTVSTRAPVDLLEKPLTGLVPRASPAGCLGRNFPPAPLDAERITLPSPTQSQAEPPRLGAVRPRVQRGLVSFAAAREASRHGTRRRWSVQPIDAVGVGGSHARPTTDPRDDPVPPLRARAGHRAESAGR